MIKFTLALFAFIVLMPSLNTKAIVYNDFYQDKLFGNQELALVQGEVKSTILQSSGSKSAYHISQLSEENSFFIELSYNSDKSEVLNKDILSKALREMTTTFIGSGFTYVSKQEADLIAKVYIDAEISDYKQGESKIYDFLSKVTIKVYDKKNKLIEESNKNIFLSGSNLEQLAISSISKSSSLAAKDIIGNLGKITKRYEGTKDVISKLKIELLFEGSSNYKFFEIVNSLIKDSSSNLKVLKRTFKYGESFNLLVLSKLDSQELAEYIIDNISNKDSFEVINVTDNRIVFRIKQG